MSKKAEKIFIDQNEDIVFILEKIRTSENDRILLVVPKHALLVSSAINLKLLSRQLARIDKSVILITKSELAEKKSESAYLISKEKPEEVNEDVWLEAGKKLDVMKSKLQKQKDELLKVRQENQQEIKISDQEPKEKFEIEQKIEEEVFDKEEVREDDVLSFKPKVEKVGAFEIMSGGNITNYNDYKPKEIEVLDDANLSSENISEDDDILESSQKKNLIEIVKNISTTIFSLFSKRKRRRKQKFIGNDWSSSNMKSQHTKRRSSKGRLSVKSNRVGGKQVKKSKSNNSNPKVKIFIYILIFGIVLYFFLILVNNLFAKAEISMVTAKEEVSLSDKFTAVADLDNIDLHAKQISMNTVSVTQASSDSGPATGQKETGEKATGVVDFLNKTDQPITLPQGTIITTLNNNLNYLLSKSVTIPARISELTPSSYENAPIVAENHGEQYNVSGVDVKVSGYKEMTELSGRIYRQVSGGTTETVQVVSQADVDSLKAGLEQRIKDGMKGLIQNELESGQMLVPGSEQYEEVSFEISPAIDTPANNFNITRLEYKLTMFTVSQDDIDIVANQLLEEQSQYKISDKEKLQPATIENLRILESGKAEFDVVKSVKVAVELDEKMLFGAIKGKRKDEAIDELKKMHNVTSVEIELKPKFIPGFMKNIPEKSEKVEFDVRSK